MGCDCVNRLCIEEKVQSHDIEGDWVSDVERGLSEVKVAWTGCVRKEPSRKIECLLERAPRQKGGEAEERPQGDSKAVVFERQKQCVVWG